MTSTMPIDRTDWDDAVPARGRLLPPRQRTLARRPPGAAGVRAPTGAFHEVNERNQDLLHRLLHEAAERRRARPGSVRHKVGDYFAAGTDEDGDRRAPGSSRSASLLARDRRDRVTPRTSGPSPPQLQRDGGGPLHALSASPRTSRMRTPTSSTSGEGGLGLPDRDYYLRTPTGLGLPRGSTWTTWRPHVLARSATPVARPRGPPRVMEIETRLAGHR